MPCAAVVGDAVAWYVGATRRSSAAVLHRRPRFERLHARLVGLRFRFGLHSATKQTAIGVLRIREGDVAKGVPVSAKISRYRFEDAATDSEDRYRVNNRRSLDELERRIDKHLQPFFREHGMSAISTADVCAFVKHRQDTGIVAVKGLRKGERIGDVSNAEINRELTILERMFSLAMQAEKLLRRPHIPLLEERNTRQGFFELDALCAALGHLPAALRPAIEFAYITGWRVPSEVLRLQWRQVDLKAGEVRLEPETTKNRDGRIFYLTDDLRALLERQQAEHDALKDRRHRAVGLLPHGRKGARR